MLDMERRKIIVELNNLFIDFSFLSDLAEFCDNNYEFMIKMISKIIKYSFCCSVTKDLSYLKKTIKVDEDYKRYLELNKKRFRFFKKSCDFDSIYSLDEDIRMSDLQGLNLPSISSMIDACSVNELNKKEYKTRVERSTKKNRDAMRFEKTAFWYVTTDLIKFDFKFMYYHSSLTGDLNIDFNILYNDERYGNNPNSPLKNSFFENLERIIKVNDIDVTRIGDLYVINNGRHRILYLMKYDCDCKIPVTVTKRIEDEEFNSILLRLKDKYKINICKNNIFNEDPNILIIYNKKTYNIKNKNELIRFEQLLEKDDNLDEFFVSEYHVIKKNSNDNSFSYIRDKMLIFWLNNKGFNIFEGNYTDYLKLSGDINSNILYEAFNLNQKIYQKYKYLGIDFEECILYRLVESTDEKDKTIRKLYYEYEEERVKIYEKEAKI